VSEAVGAAVDPPPVERTPWQLLIGLLAQQKRGLIAGVIVGLIWAAAKVSIPSLIRHGIDQGIEGHDSLLKWSLLIAAAGVVAGICAAWRRWLAFRESRTTESTLRERLFNHILRLDVAYHDHAQTGQLMSRASSDLQQIQAFVVMIPLTLSNLFMLIAILILLVNSDPLLAVIALAPLPFVNVSARRFSSMIHPAVMAVQVKQAALAAVVEESVSGVRVVKGFGAEGVQSRKLAHEADEIRTASLEAARIRSRFLPAIDVLPSLGLIAVLAIGGHRVLNGDMTVGQLIQFNASVLLLIWPMRNIGMTLATGQRAAVALQRVQQVLTTKATVADPPAPIRLPTEADPVEADPVEGRPDQAAAHLGAIEFHDVSFGYGEARQVLDGFDVSIPAGTSVAIVGATGSGKSTITRLLLRFYDVRRGSIEIDGCDIRSIPLAELRRAVGVVFEDTLLFHDTVAANIAFAEPSAGMDRIESAARLAGAHEFIGELPDGYNTLLGERGFSLSGGQRQRIAIARAILADPRVLILDDATSAVDPSKEHEIREAMATVMRDRTTIVIAHRPGTIALADTVILLDGGCVAAQGTHDELLASDSRYRDVLAAWAARDEEVLVDDGVLHDGDLVDDVPRIVRGKLADDIDLEASMHEPIGGE